MLEFDWLLIVNVDILALLRGSIRFHENYLQIGLIKATWSRDDAALCWQFEVNWHLMDVLMNLSRSRQRQQTSYGCWGCATRGARRMASGMVPGLTMRPSGAWSTRHIVNSLTSALIQTESSGCRWRTTSSTSTRQVSARLLRTSTETASTTDSVSNTPLSLYTLIGVKCRRGTARRCVSYWNRFELFLVCTSMYRPQWQL